ncbi:competence protein CoiA family protein [Lactobacillus sp. YT155]|uniref:competence protein CoiA n=1 Tax=Lactobacillus sp. YT155 TaxID=3060955 RepID=UPI00265F12C7|nr:competence protein CoiA family protein [Lactobacillus sp. YT155]MDO1605158.1 competence protein CoiA family protein [Lactobacillus sp. YT155]
MFAARDSTGQLVYAKLENNQTREYFCVDCHQQVKLIITKNNHKYFKHAKVIKISNNETQLHQRAKTILKQEFEKINYNVELEKITQFDQRIDLLAANRSRKIAVEFQNSPISNRNLEERILGYQENGYQNFWLLSLNYYQKKLSNRQLKFLNYHHDWHWYVLFFDVRRRHYILIYDIYFYGWTNNQSYRRAYFMNLAELRKFSPTESTREIIIEKNPDENFKRFCYQKQFNYLKQKNQSIKLPPVLKYDLVKTLFLYQNQKCLEGLITIPALIKIKPQIREFLYSEVERIISRLLVTIC